MGEVASPVARPIAALLLRRYQLLKAYFLTSQKRRSPRNQIELRLLHAMGRRPCTVPDRPTLRSCSLPGATPTAWILPDPGHRLRGDGALSVISRFMALPRPTWHPCSSSPESAHRVARRGIEPGDDIEMTFWRASGAKLREQLYNPGETNLPDASPMRWATSGTATTGTSRSTSISAPSRSSASRCRQQGGSFGNW